MGTVNIHTCFIDLHYASDLRNNLKEYPEYTLYLEDLRMKLKGIFPIRQDVMFFYTLTHME